MVDNPITYKLDDHHPLFRRMMRFLNLNSLHLEPYTFFLAAECANADSLVSMNLSKDAIKVLREIPSLQACQTR